MSKNSPFDGTIYDLVNHIKNTAFYKIYFEKFDMNLLSALNDLTDKDVADFHRDNFMKFNNINSKLSKR